MTPGKWRKSSRSNPNGGNCVETRTFNHTSALVEVRDSKAPQLGSLAINRTDFTALLDSLKLQRLRSSGPPKTGGLSMYVTKPQHWNHWAARAQRWRAVDVVVAAWSATDVRCLRVSGRFTFFSHDLCR